jgi:molybdopterin synthase catalytic subunit
VCERFVTDDVVAIAAEHRVGRLGIGDTAVVVVVSAAHRDAALRTSSRLIDAIKAEVPIWKHQFFADGSDEWVNCA